MAGSPNRRAAAAAVLCVVCACGGSRSGRVGEQPSWRRAEPSAQPLAPIVFAPSRPGVRSYNQAARASEVSELETAMGRAATDASLAVGKPAPVLDPRLSAAAAELASVAPEDAQLAYPLVEFALQRQGIIEPSPHIIVIWGEGGGDADEYVDSLRERLPEILGSPAAPHTRYGVGRAERGDETCVVVAFQASYIETSEIPRSMPSNASISVEGAVRGPYTHPQMFVTRKGVVDQPEVRSSGDGRFRARVGCRDHRGRMQVEITAVDSSGSTVLANFPIWCGEEAPARIVHEASSDDTQPVRSESEAETRMLELLNRDREANGLGPLVADERLSAVARSHSREMAETGRVAHVSPTTGSAADRVAKAHIRTAVVLENVARAYGVAQAQAGLMNSPGHRANILSRDVSHVGLGVVFGKGEPGRTEMFVTQVFARVPDDISAPAAQGLVRAKVGKARQGMAEDPALSAIAGEFAQRVARGESTTSAGQWASSKLRQMRSSYLSVSTVATAVADVTAFDPASALTERGLTHFGVGVAKGNHPVMGDGAFYIVLLIAQR